MSKSSEAAKFMSNAGDKDSPVEFGQLLGNIFTNFLEKMCFPALNFLSLNTISISLVLASCAFFYIYLKFRGFYRLKKSWVFMVNLIFALVCHVCLAYNIFPEEIVSQSSAFISMIPWIFIIQKFSISIMYILIVWFSLKNMVYEHLIKNPNNSNKTVNYYKSRLNYSAIKYAIRLISLLETLTFVSIFFTKSPYSALGWYLLILLLTRIIPCIIYWYNLDAFLKNLEIMGTALVMDSASSRGLFSKDLKAFNEDSGSLSIILDEKTSH